MHLWKKVILFSLSSFIFACNSENSEKIEPLLSPEDYLLVLIENRPIDLVQQIDSISTIFVQNKSDIQLLNIGNNYEPTSILLVSKEKSAIQGLSDYFNEKSIATSHYDDFYIWTIRNEQGDVINVSQYPHPVLNWVIEVKQ